MSYFPLIQDGYGQIELNQVAFRRDGRIEAQCALDATDFATEPAENGMILVIDKKTKTVRFPKADDENVVYGLNYSSEHMYDERARGLKNFKLKLGEFYPRLGILAKGDRYTTNAVCANTENYADIEAIKTAVSTGRVYGIPSTQGYVELVADPEDAALVLEAVEFTTMPDGQPGIKFLVVKD